MAGAPGSFSLASTSAREKIDLAPQFQQAVSFVIEDAPQYLDTLFHVRQLKAVTRYAEICRHMYRLLTYRVDNS